MSDPKAMGTLVLRIVGPIGGDETSSSGATAYITTGDEDPIAVIVPRHLSIKVDVPAGRVVVVLRTCSGKRDRRQLVLQPGAKEQIDFGRKEETRAVISENHIIIPDRVKPPAPIGTQVTDWNTAGSLSGGGSSDAKPLPLMDEIRCVHIVQQRDPDASVLSDQILDSETVPNTIVSFGSTRTLLDISSHDVFAFLVELAKPHKGRVVLHRAPRMVGAPVRFTVKPSGRNETIPIDSEVHPRDERVMPLLAFLAKGDIPSARVHARRFCDTAAELLRNKYAEPQLAALGAYALLKLRESEPYQGWLENLYRDFKDMSDGAILYAMQFMRARPGAIGQWYKDARDALVAAAKRPVPLLTDGVHLLVEGLEMLSSSKRAEGDQELVNALGRARWLETRARPDEIFTALWLHKSELAQAFLPLDYNKHRSPD